MTTALERGWWVSVTPRPLFTPEKDPVPILQEAGWAPGPAWIGAENLAPTRIQSPDRPARSQSLYRVRYPAHRSWHYVKYYYFPVSIHTKQHTQVEFATVCGLLWTKDKPVVLRNNDGLQCRNVLSNHLHTVLCVTVYREIYVFEQ